MNEKTEGWEIRITEMDLFTGLDLNVMREIADTACTEVTYTKGTVIFTEGESANALFILEKGTVDLKIGGEKTVYKLFQRCSLGIELGKRGIDGDKTQVWLKMHSTLLPQSPIRIFRQ